LARVEFSVQVHPNAGKNEVAGITDGVWRIRVAAPPVKGKANKELVAYLSRLLGVGKSQIDIIKGHTGRRKIIAIDGLTQEDITERLSGA
jgi:uncharacterized protein (TIGR00251 family)